MLAVTTTTTGAETMSAEQGMAIFAGFGIIIAIFLIIGLVTFALSLWMLIDAFGRNEEDFPMGSKAIWIVVLIAGIFLGYGLFSALVYYFVVRRKAKQAASAQQAADPSAKK